MGLNIANTAGYTKRSVSSAGLFVGYCIGELICQHHNFGKIADCYHVGNFIGPLLFKAEESPKFGSAWAAVVGTTLASIVCIMLYGLACVWDNRRRDRMGSEGFEHAYEDDLTDVKVRLPDRAPMKDLTGVTESTVPLRVLAERRIMRRECPSRPAETYSAQTVIENLYVFGGRHSVPRHALHTSTPDRLQTTNASTPHYSLVELMVAIINSFRQDFHVKSLSGS